MREQPQTIEDILRELVVEDRAMLGRADEFIAALEQRMPGSLARQANPVKIALRKQVGEMLLIADEDESQRIGLAERIEELLAQTGIQRQAAMRTAEALVCAMDWRENISAEDEEGENEEIAPIDFTDFLEGPPTSSAEESPAWEASQAEAGQFPQIWTCHCGHKNDSEFCGACGARKGSVPLVPSDAPVCEPMPSVAPAEPTPVQPGEQPSSGGKTMPALLVICVSLAAVVVFLAVKSFGGEAENPAVYHETKKAEDAKTEAPAKPADTQPSVVPSGEHWIQDKASGVYLWNPEPKAGEYITWSGGYVKDGSYLFADGPGTITWSREGKVFQVDNGTMVHGRHHGTFTLNYSSVR